MKLIIFLGILLAIPLQAQIRGVVLDDLDSPIIGAIVHWQKTGVSVTTDANGKFNIKQSNDLNDTLSISAVGFDTLQLAYEAVAENNQLKLQPTSLDQLIIEEEQQSSDKLSFDPRNVEVMNAHELGKAACCNLSEAFETNAAVDVSMTDAVSGAKKIQLLGLDGVYTQFLFENLPILDGLGKSYGMNSIPGTWVDAINITKGNGSVRSGYESMVGQINLSFIDPKNSPLLFINGYGNIYSRAELNIQNSNIINKKWSQSNLIHFSHLQNENDFNEDGFIDIPTGSQLSMLQRWKYIGKNYMSQFGFQINHSQKHAGTLSSQQEFPAWNSDVLNQHLDVFWKNGWSLKKSPYSSIALLTNAKRHDLGLTLGNKNYTGVNYRWYTQLMYADIIKNSNHKINVGPSFTYNSFEETFNDSIFNRVELVPGVHAEYTYANSKQLSMVLGGRVDYHNMFGWLWTPRLNIRYFLTENLSLKLSGGKGYRTPNAIADNIGMLANNRNLVVMEIPEIEESYNFGISQLLKFKLFDREAFISGDYFYTTFENQLVLDRDIDLNNIYVYNLKGSSYSHSFQLELGFEPIKGFDIKVAYKFYDVKVTSNGMLQNKVLTPRNRGMLNLSYQTRNKKWQYDLTANWIGSKRMIPTNSPVVAYNRAEKSPSFVTLNAQITKRFKGNWAMYVGAENLTNFRQNQAIIANDNPQSPYFDASNIWGPIVGANIYVGFRYELKQKEK